MNLHPCFSRLRHRALTITLLLLVPLGISPSSAQPTAGDGAVSVGGGNTLTIGGLLQTDAYLGRPSGDGFRVRTTRLRFGGEAQTLQYVVHADIAASPVLLDAFARLPLTNRFRLTAGLFKTPFGREFLTSRPDLLFVERARVANNIPPNRQVGIAVEGTLLSDRMTATVGAFNGTRGLRPNDNDLLLYVGRLTGRVSLDDAHLQLGTNASYSIDDGVALSGLARPAFTGTRLLFGVDAQFEIDRWILTGELNTGQLDPEESTNTSIPFGFSLGAGAYLTDEHQFVGRVDQFDPDAPMQAAPETQIHLGYNYEPTPMLRVLVNYQAPLETSRNGFVTTRLQIALR